MLLLVALSACLHITAVVCATQRYIRFVVGIIVTFAVVVVVAALLAVCAAMSWLHFSL